MPKNKYRVYRQALIDRRLRQKCCPTPSKKDLKDYIEQTSSSTDTQVIIEQYEKLNALRRYFNFNLNKSLTWNYTGSLLRKTMDMLYA